MPHSLGMLAAHFLKSAVSPAGKSASGQTLRVVSSGIVIATSVELARDSTARRRGLLGRNHLPLDTAMIIAPCTAIHTFGMRFAIDVIFAARNGRVLKVTAALEPRRVAFARGGFAAIEMASGEAKRHGVRTGDYLVVD